MKTTKLILIGLAIAAVAGTAWAAPYVEMPNGSRVAGTAIRALANGDINLTIEGGIRTFPKGSYLKAVADKPAEYDQAAAAIKAQKYDAAVPLLEGVVAKYRFLGWDVEASKLLAQALLGKGAALGTTLAFMMSVIALSLPEMIILRKVLTLRLIAVFISVVGAGILAVGFLFNVLFH